MGKYFTPVAVNAMSRIDLFFCGSSSIKPVPWDLTITDVLDHISIVTERDTRNVGSDSSD